MSLPAPEISVVVACFEEEAALPRLFGELDRLAGAARFADGGLEVVAVDDGSRDATAALLARWAREGAGRRVVTHPENRGFGAAMRTGFRAARGAVVVSYDADATYPVMDILRLADALEGADAAGASPFAAGGTAGEAKAGRRLLSRVVAGLYRLALRERRGRFTAWTCAFRAYRREALGRMDFHADGFLAAAECLVLLRLGGARVREIPSRLSKRAAGRSSMRLLPVAAAHLRLLAALFLRLGRFRSRPRPVRVSAPPDPLAESPGEPSAWNAELNRRHPMTLITGSPNPLVRWIEERRRRTVLRLAAPRPGQAVLDAGAERGAYAGRLRDQCAVGIGLDVDPAVLAGRPGGVAGDAARLPFRDRSFPRVLLAEVLEHCPAPGEVVAEALRVTRASGRVAVSVPDDQVIVTMKRWLRRAGLGRMLPGLAPGLAPGHLHVFGRDSLRRLLARRGRLVSFTRDLAAFAFFAVVTPRSEER